MAAHVRLLVHARRGDVWSTEESIGRGREEYFRAEPDPSGWLVWGIDDAEVSHYAGLAYRDLAPYDSVFAARAVEAASTAIQLRDPSETRAVLLIQINLALNSYRCGDTDSANFMTGKVVAALPQVSSRRLATRLQPLAIEAAAHDSTAADLARRLNAVTTT